MTDTIIKIFDPEGKLDAKSVEFLTNALETSSQEGFDYIKFKTSVTELIKLNMDETTAMRSAFTTAKAMGLSKDKLVHSLNHYNKVLHEEKEQFRSAMDKQLKKRVSSKENETEYLKEKIIEYKSKIKELEKNIASYEHKVAYADEEIEKEKEKINSTEQRFITAHEEFVATLQSDLEKINNIL